MASLTGKAPQVLNRQTRQGGYVAARVAGANRFPVWQLTDGGTVPSKELQEVFHCYGDQRRWQWIAFLRSAQPDLEAHTPIDWLKNGQPLEPVLRLARKDTGQLEAL